MNIIRSLDPRRSLVAGIIWLVIALAASFAIAASIWAGQVAREIVVQQHVRRLALETDQLASDMGQAVSARLRALNVVGATVQGPQLFNYLNHAYPDLGWIALADAAGRVIAGNGGTNSGSIATGNSVAATPWFSEGLHGAWIGVVEQSRGSHNAPQPGEPPLLGDLSAPVTDGTGHVVGVIAAHLTWHWASQDVARLSQTLDSRGSAQTLVLDRAGTVLVGPEALRGRPWPGVVQSEGIPRFERLPSGQSVLVAKAAVSGGTESAIQELQVQLSEPKEQVYQRADALAIRIWWISICLGAATASIGALGARHLTIRLRQLTQSAAAVGRNEAARIEVPSGRDEVAQLAAAFAKVLDDLRQERTELLTLSSELERRVAVRTREVERLAEEARYAAIVRERLKIARDLHDTLAHSMMAMLSEVRLLRKLQSHDPASLPDELARAEEVAHAGLNEARTAITQMRVNAVRDTGLGAALSTAFERFIDRTALRGEFRADPGASGFGDERAEILFRMAEEALRNIERHAMATRALVRLETAEGTELTLRIEDDGVGFDAGAPRPGHYGLVGLHEQAQLIGAHLDIDSAPNRGTIVTVTLRMTPESL